MSLRESHLQELLTTKDIASWYCSMSKGQQKAIKSLHLALRDDIEQGSSYRVHKSLHKIGINPIMASPMLKMLINASRGSTLAFLYFILEAYYKTSSSGFTGNEQLLMTSIMHLDLVFTLGGLDKILPPAAIKLHRPSKISKSSTRSIHATKPTTRKASQRFPYFQKQPRPKEIPVQYKCPKPSYRVNFSFWRVGHKPEYTDKNEKRWFADYVLQPAARNVKFLINNTVDFLLSGAEIHLSKDPNLCMYHQTLSKQADLTRDKLKVAARDRCLDLMDISGPERKLRQEFIINQLKADVDWYTKKFETIKKLQLTPIHTMRQNLKAECDMCGILVTTLAEPHFMRELHGEEDVKRLETVTTDTVKTINDANATLKVENLLNSDEDTTQKPFIKIAKKPEAGRKCKQLTVLYSIDTVGCEKKENTVGNGSFFTAPTPDLPSTFNYLRLFSIKDVGENYYDVIYNACLQALKRERLKRSTILANGENHLATCADHNHDRSTPCNSQVDAHRRSTVDEMNFKSDKDVSCDRECIARAIVGCVKTIWAQQVQSQQLRNEQKKYAAIFAALQTIEDELKKISGAYSNVGKAQLAALHDSILERKQYLLDLLGDKIEEKEKPKVEKVVYEGIEHFDPDNDELMERLLKDGMKILRKDNRYVFASFPDSHKLSIMREWIRRRYGKRYTYQDMLKSLKESIGIFRMVMSLQNQIPKLPKHAIPKELVPFDRLKEIRKLGEDLGTKYHRALNTTLMQHATYLWTAMGGFMCPGGSPRDLFYAYMPAMVSDIIRIKPWNGEHIDMKLYAELRKRQQAKESGN